MSTFISKTTSEQELDLFLEQMDGWDVADELQVEQLTDGFLCRFTFPDGDAREDKVLGYLHANAEAWQPMKLADATDQVIEDAKRPADA